MSTKKDKSVVTLLKSRRNKGIAIVGLCILACKIPLLLLLLGFGGLSASLPVFNFPPMVQSIGLVLVVISIAFGILYFGYRAYRRGNV